MRASKVARWLARQERGDAASQKTAVFATDEWVHNMSQWCMAISGSQEKAEKQLLDVISRHLDAVMKVQGNGE